MERAVKMIEFDSGRPACGHGVVCGANTSQGPTDHWVLGIDGPKIKVPQIPSAFYIYIYTHTHMNDDLVYIYIFIYLYIYNG